MGKIIRQFRPMEGWIEVDSDDLEDMAPWPDVPEPVNDPYVTDEEGLGGDDLPGVPTTAERIKRVLDDLVVIMNQRFDATARPIFIDYEDSMENMLKALASAVGRKNVMDEFL